MYTMVKETQKQVEFDYVLFFFFFPVQKQNKLQYDSAQVFPNQMNIYPMFQYEVQQGDTDTFSCVPTLILKFAQNHYTS